MPPPVPTAPIAIPVIPRSPSKHAWTRRTSRKSECRPRMYSEDPLPIRPSDEAPRKAHITGRIAEPDRVAYTIEIGGVQVDDVGIDEILDYVSAYDLEQYEHRKFEEEGEILKVAKLEAEAEAERRRERQRHRAKTKGTVLFEEVSDDDDDDDDNDDDDEDQSDETGSALGRHGRSRPTYTHLFEKGRQRKRRRKRDPDTGELMPLSDEENDAEPVIPDLVLPVYSRPPAPPFAALPKRRRRKRDKATGELLPLEPLGQRYVTEALASPSDGNSEVVPAPRFQRTARSSATKVEEPSSRKRDVLTGGLLPLESLDKRLSDKKRPRRRRHPLTGELMPLGWRYDPKTEGTTYERRRDGTDSGSPAFKPLSLSQEQEPKRMKLTSRASSDKIVHGSPKPSSPKQRSFSVKSERSESDERSMRNEHEEDDDESEIEAKPTPRPVSVHRTGPTPKASLLRPDARANTLSKAAVDTSPEPMNLKSFLGTNRQRSSAEESSSSSEMDVKKFQQRSKVTAATIMNPVAAAHESEDEEEDDDDEEEGWDIENILAHQMSDPRTHPGKPSVMLYKVKWVGYDDPSWEPAASFNDPSIIEEYERSIGMRDERMQL